MADRKAYEELLGRVFDEMRGSLRDDLSPSDYEKLRWAFVFHMTDWLDDLEMMADLSENPGSKSVDQATHSLVGCLYHVVPHIQAAARFLLGDVGDPFAGDALYGLLDRPVKSDLGG
jgi:hypothetical protein